MAKPVDAVYRFHAAGICDCCDAPEQCCPVCGGEDVSCDLPGYLVDVDGPNPPMVCEECGARWWEDDDRR